MATIAPRRTREARRTNKTPEPKPTERATPKKEQGRISRFIDNRLKASAAKRDQALAAVEAKKISPTERLKLDAIDQRRTAAARVKQEVMEAIVEQEKRLSLSNTSHSERHGASDRDIDGMIDDNSINLYAVCDGAGEVSRTIVEEIQTKWHESIAEISDEAQCQEMRRIMGEVNTEINAAHNSTVRASSERKAAAATIVRFFTRKDGKRVAVVGHVGDTRLYVKHADGRMEQITRHDDKIEPYLQQMDAETAAELRKKFLNLSGKPDDTLNSNDVLCKANGEKFPDYVTENWLYDQGGVATRHFGDAAVDFQPQVTSFVLQEGDTVLLSTHGVHDLVPEDRLSETLTIANSSTIADNIVADSKQNLRVGPGGKIDGDRTAIVIDVSVDRLANEVALAKNEYRQWAEAASKQPLPVPVTNEQKEGLRSLLNERRDLYQTLYGGAMQRYAELMANDIYTYDAWCDSGLYISTSDIMPHLEPVNLAVVDRRGIYLTKVEDMIKRATTAREALPASADVLRASVKYIETTEIAQDAVLLNAVMSVLEQVAGKSSEAKITPATLVTNLAVQELAKALGFKTEIVVELLINQVQAIGEAARQQEKAQRSVSWNIAKAVGYGLAGVGLAASMVATPMATMAGIGVVRALDAFVTTRVHEKNRKKIEAEMRKQLRDDVLAFKNRPSAEQTNDKVPDGLRNAVDSFVALLALAKRDQIDGHQASFETKQVAVAALADKAMAGDVAARAEYDNTVQSDANIFMGRRISELEVTMGDPERADLQRAEETLEQFFSTHSTTRTARTEHDERLLLQEINEKREAWQKKFEQIVRIASAERALYVMDKTTQMVEAQARLSADSRKSLWDRVPSLRALVGGGETVSEKVTSIGVFMGLGFIARQSDVARVALSGYAGARAGEALARLEQRYHETVEDKRAKLNEGDVQAINLDSPQVFAQLDALTPRVAVARRRLIDGDLRTKNPAEFARVLKLVERYDSLRVTAEARRSLYRVAHHTDEIFEAHKTNVSTLEANRTNIRRCALLGAVAGELLGVEIVESIAQRAEALANEQATVTDASATTTADASPEEESAADDVDAARAAGASTARTNAGASEPARSAETTVPNAATTDVEAAGTATHPDGADAAAASTTARLVEGRVLPDRSVELPGIRTLTEREWRAAVVHGGIRDGHRWGEGAWHALKEQADAPKILTLLKETKIKMPGGDMPIFDPEHGTQLGVRTPDTLAVILHKDAAGHETLRFFDAPTHKEIAAEDLHKYFYKMGIHTETVAAADVSHTGIAAMGVSGEGAPAGTADMTEGVTDFARHLWHDGMTRAEYISAYLDAHRPPLDDTVGAIHDTALHPALGRFGSGWSTERFSYADASMLEKANQAYNAIISHDGDGDAEPLAAATTGGRVESTAPVATGSNSSTAERSSGGGRAKEAAQPVGARLPEPKIISADSNTTLDAAEKAALDFSKRNYGQDDFSTFLYNAKTLLVEVGGRKPSFIGDNNLVFATRGAGAVYVDVPNTGRPAELLTEQLYQTIQHHYETVLKAQNRIAFSASDWETIIRAYKVAQRGARAAA